MILADVLRQQLVKNAIPELFTIPGDFILPWLSALEVAEPAQLQPQTVAALRLIQLSHEPSAVYAADAAARCRNAPAAVMLTYGAGALNAVNAVAQAYMEYVPLLIFAGYPSAREIQSGLLLHHQLGDADAQRRIFTEITCAQCRLDDAATAPALLQQIIATARRERRPVLIELPRDMARAEIDKTLPAPLPAVIAAPAVLNVDDARRVAAVVAHCRTPLMLVGVKTKRFGFTDAVTALADQHQLPVLTTLLGRTVLDPKASWYAGVFSGSKADPTLPLLQQADVLIICGVIRSDSNFAAHADLLAQSAVIWIDADETRLPDGSLITAPASTVLQLLQQQLPTQLQWPSPLLTPLAGTAEMQPWGSDAVVQTLHQRLSAQTGRYPFVVDIGDCLFATLAANPDIFIAPAFYASMGFAVPAALGVQLCTGERPIVLVGDGAFQMTGLELGHCQRYGLNPIVIVLNNQSWGMIKAFAPDLTATGLTGWQYSALGRGMGGGAAQVWNAYQLANAIDDALADTSRFRLIEVMLPAHSYSKPLADFSAALCGASTTEHAQT